MNFYALQFDGSCGPKNPGGTAAYGFILTHNGVELERGSGVIGSGPTMSNNLAEHFAVGEGLAAFLKHYKDEPQAILRIRGDSQLVIKQLNKKWKAHPDKLYYNDYLRSMDLLLQVRRRKVTVIAEWVPRAQNGLCDDLSKAYKIHNKLSE